MKTNVFGKSIALALLGAFLSCGVSKAQSPLTNPFQNRLGQYQRKPTVNANLLLNRGGVSYFTQVRPQLQAQQQINQLGNQLNAQTLSGQPGGLPRQIGTDPKIQKTGLKSRFYNYSHYYRFRTPAQSQ